MPCQPRGNEGRSDSHSSSLGSVLIRPPRRTCSRSGARWNRRRTRLGRGFGVDPPCPNATANMSPWTKHGWAFSPVPSLLVSLVCVPRGHLADQWHCLRAWRLTKYHPCSTRGGYWSVELPSRTWLIDPEISTRHESFCGCKDRRSSERLSSGPEAGRFGDGCCASRCCSSSILDSHGIPLRSTGSCPHFQSSSSSALSLVSKSSDFSAGGSQWLIQGPPDYFTSA